MEAFQLKGCSATGGAANDYVHRYVISGQRACAGTMLGGTGVAVSKQSSHQPEAIAYAKWLANPKHQRGPYFQRGNSQPVCRPGPIIRWTLPLRAFFSAPFRLWKLPLCVCASTILCASSKPPESKTIAVCTEPCKMPSWSNGLTRTMLPFSVFLHGGLPEAGSRIRDQP